MSNYAYHSGLQWEQNGHNIWDFYLTYELKTGEENFLPHEKNYISCFMCMPHYMKKNKKKTRRIKTTFNQIIR